jgi:GntR family transcriptional regulator
MQTVLLVDREPRMVITSWLPLALFPDLPARHIEPLTIRRILETYYGAEPISQHKEIEVTVLDGEEADFLHVRKEMPAFLFTTLSRLSDGRPFEFRRQVVRGDRYRFFLDIDPGQGQPSLLHSDE